MAYKNWIVKNGIALCLIPKNGSTSFRDALSPSKEIDGNEALSFSKRVVFVRDPIERFRSAYTFFNYLNETDQNGQKTRIPMSATHDGYESWVDFALSTDNEHWTPQVEIIKNMQTISHRFNLENIQKYWGEYWHGKRPDWMNASTSHLPTNDYRKLDIEKFYHEDLILFNSIPVI